MIHARNNHLTSGELEQFAEATLAIRRDQAFGHKDDLRTLALSRPRDSVIVTDRTAPGIEDLEAFKHFTIDGRGSTPREVAVVIAKDGNG